MTRVEGSPEPFEPFTIITGENEIIQTKIDLFFQEIINFLGYNENAVRAFVQREVMNLAFEDSLFKDSCLRTSDDRITVLLVRNYAVASVIERRNDNNFVEVLAASYITSERVKRLREGVVF